MIFVYNDIRKVPPHSRPPTSYDKWGGGGEITCKKTTAISGHFWPLRQRADDLWRCGNGGSN